MERVTVLFLAAVVSLCATQAVPVRTTKSSEIPAVIQLVEARSSQILRNKTEISQQAPASPAARFSEVSLLALQDFPDVLSPRAPPV
jgi:hypothetical protein